MKIYKNMTEKAFPTPFHAYQHMNVRDFTKILEDIETDKLRSNIGQMFDVSFPINDAEADAMTNGRPSPFTNNGQKAVNNYVGGFGIPGYNR